MSYPKFKKYSEEIVTFVIDNKTKLSAMEIAKAKNLSINQVHYIYTRLGILKGKKFKVHIGERYGKLVVIEYLGRITNKKFGLRYWRCLCDCGNETIVSTSLLICGHTQSCGCGRIDAISYTYKNITGVWYGATRQSALARGFEFNVSMEYLNDLLEKQNFKCALSGLPIKINEGRKTKETTASLDRIDNNKGYTEDNVQFLHKNVNYMKWKHNQKYFLELCNTIAEYQKNAN